MDAGDNIVTVTVTRKKSLHRWYWWDSNQQCLD